MLAAKMPEAMRVDYITLPVPEINDEQVLIKNIYMGLCASDIQIYQGKHKYMTFPVIPGHESVSEVVKVGAKVTGFKAGDRVALQPQVTCHECYPCEIGRMNVCENLRVMGVHMDGCACEFMAVNPMNLHMLPDGLSYEVAALTEPLAVGVGSVKRGPSCKGANVAVVGAGTVGNFAAQAARALGAEKVLIVDIFDEKLKVAEACGIDFCVNTREKSLLDAVNYAFGPKRRADIIIDCAATKGSFAAILAAARRSSSIIISGNFKEPVEFNIPVIQRSEISFIGHMMYVREDFADAIRFLADGSVKTDGIVTKHYPLNRYGEAFGFIEKHPAESMKILIDIA